MAPLSMTSHPSLDSNHPITPPPELVEQWECEYHHMTWGPDMSMFLTEKAARWGADQELEACCEWLVAGPWFSPDGECIKDLRAARRPTPPSLKEQALEEIQEIEGAMYSAGLGCDFTATRRALESLPD